MCPRAAFQTVNISEQTTSSWHCVSTFESPTFTAVWTFLLIMTENSSHKSPQKVSTCLNVLSDAITAPVIYQWAACCLHSHGSRVNVTAEDYGSEQHAVVTACSRRSWYFWHNAYGHMRYLIFQKWAILGWEGRKIKNMKEMRTVTQVGGVRTGFQM